MFLSSTSNVAVLIDVVVPLTVKLPVTVALPAILIFVDVISSDVNVPSTVTLLNVTFEVVATACPIHHLKSRRPYPRRSARVLRSRSAPCT